MNTYHKIQTVYFRDPDNNFKTLSEGTFSKPEFELLKDIPWTCTEKIDGMNVRVMWNGQGVTFGGKTDNAQIPATLVKVLQGTFTVEIMKEVFGDTENVCIYGEGYGSRIQKGGNYLPNSVNFILFDIKVGNWWLTREACEEITSTLNIDIVPIIKVCTLTEAVNYVKEGFKSTISDNKDYIAEGFIMKPMVELFDRAGRRIITKIKYKDFNRD